MFEVIRNNVVISKHHTRSAAEKNMNRLMKKESIQQSKQNAIYGFIGWDNRINSTGIYHVKYKKEV